MMMNTALGLLFAAAACGRYQFEAIADEGAPDAARTLLEMPGCVLATCDGVALHLCSTLATWQEGQAACTAASSTLARIETASHAVCVGYAMASAGIEYAWIGLVQAPGQPAPDVGWTWNGSPAATTIFWAPAEPSDIDAVESDEHDCGRVQAPNALAADRNCGDRMAYLCAPR